MGLIIFLVVMAFIFFWVYQEAMNSQHTPESSSKDNERRYGSARGYKSYGKIEIQDADHEFVRQVFKGTGTMITDTVFLDTGVYYLVCQFPIDDTIQVDLITPDEEFVKTIVNASGFSTVTFSVDTSRKYRLHVQVEDAAVAWTLLIKPL